MSEGKWTLNKLRSFHKKLYTAETLDDGAAKLYKIITKNI